MPQSKARTAIDPRSRQRIIELLKRGGPQDALSLARQLGLTGMAVRRHLYELEQERLATHEAQPRPMGRPAKMWRLTPAADRLFPDRHSCLVVDILASLTSEFGPRGIEKLIANRSRAQVERYRQLLPRRGSLKQRLEKLASLRTDEGYMAEVLSQQDGSFLLVENHCPICTAAAACTGLCSAELDVFREVLGPGVQLERTDHILQGARRCAYRVQNQSRNKQRSEARKKGTGISRDLAAAATNRRTIDKQLP
jgi:predicted ArsR family transcriptional regulator